MLKRCGTTILIAAGVRLGWSGRGERGADGCCRGGVRVARTRCAIRGDDATIACWGADVGRRARRPLHGRRRRRPPDLRDPRGGRRGRLLGPGLLAADAARRARSSRSPAAASSSAASTPTTRSPAGAATRGPASPRCPRAPSAPSRSARTTRARVRDDRTAACWGYPRLRHGTPPAGEFSARRGRHLALLRRARRRRRARLLGRRVDARPARRRVLRRLRGRAVLLRRALPATALPVCWGADIGAPKQAPAGRAASLVTRRAPHLRHPPRQPRA